MDSKIELQASQSENLMLHLLMKVLAQQEALAVVIPEFLCTSEDDKEQFVATVRDQFGEKYRALLEELYLKYGKLNIDELLGE